MLGVILVTIAILPLTACGLAAGTGAPQEFARCPPPQPSLDAITLVGHTWAVSALAWSPDGTTLASAGGDRTVRLWSADGTLRRVFPQQARSPHGLSWSPDGRMLAVAADDGLRLWSSDGATVRLVPMPPGVRSVAWSPDGRTIAVGLLDGRMQLRDADGGFRADPGGHGGRVEAVGWSPDGRTLVSAGTDTSVRIWGADGGRGDIFREHRGPVVALAWRPDGAVFASGSSDGTARLWSADGKPLATLNDGGAGVNAVAWSPDGRPVRRTGACASGPPMAVSPPPSPGTATRWRASPGRPMAASWRVGRTTARSGCGGGSEWDCILTMRGEPLPRVRWIRRCNWRYLRL